VFAVHLCYTVHSSADGQGVGTLLTVCSRCTVGPELASRCCGMLRLLDVYDLLQAGQGPSGVCMAGHYLLPGVTASV
jgi:hypothetical protein